MLKKFFEPKSVAVIGASRTPTKIGYVILRNFVKSLHGKTFDGKVYPINPNADKIAGLKAYPSVKEVKDKIDMAVIAVPAKTVPRVLKECINKKIEAVIIVSGGFSETGKRGEKLEQELKKIIKGTRTRIMGVNCVGVYDPSKSLDTIFNPRERLGRPPAGEIGLVSQSGAVGVTILDRFAEKKIGVSKFISYENATDINETDCIEYLGNDKKTKVIVLFVEGIKDGKRFIKVAKRVSKKKPIIALKGGKTGTGAKAAASHTGSLAGSAKIYSGAFKQSGLIEAKNWEELLDFTKIFLQPLPKGRRIAIVTNGGGFGVLAADACEAHGLGLPPLPADVQKKMKRVLPPYAIASNPMDLTGDATTERFKVALEACMESRSYDGVIAITLFGIPTLGKDVTDVIVGLKKFNKPIVCCTVGGEYTVKLSRKIESGGTPVYTSPERAAKAMSTLVNYRESIRK